MCMCMRMRMCRDRGRVININGYDRIRKYYLQPGDYKTDDEAELMDENFGAEQDEVEF